MNPENPVPLDIKEFTLPELIDWLDRQGVARYRAAQIMKWVYPRQADDFSVMSDLARPLRQTLAAHFIIRRQPVLKRERAADGTRKYLFGLADGQTVETVRIPEKDHYTLCISSQVGCAQGCRFCLTAQSGFIRNLSAGEIIAQVRDVLADIGPDDPRRLSNIVFMGMGEPLANYRNLIRAATILTSGDHGLKFSPRRVTVSTAGLVPRLLDLSRQTDLNLAISLNATNNKTRDALMPINRKYPIEQLLEACGRCQLKPRQRITFEYILIDQTNDSPEDARRLVKLLHPIRAKVNLIPFNPHPGSPFNRPSEPAILKFQKILQDAHLTAIIRQSKGADISAACGQLRARNQ